MDIALIWSTPQFLTSDTTRHKPKGWVFFLSSSYWAEILVKKVFFFRMFFRSGYQPVPLCTLTDANNQDQLTSTNFLTLNGFNSHIMQNFSSIAFWIVGKKTGVWGVETSGHLNPKTVWIQTVKAWPWPYRSFSLLEFEARGVRKFTTGIAWQPSVHSNVA